MLVDNLLLDMVEWKHEMDQMVLLMVYPKYNTLQRKISKINLNQLKNFTCNSPNDDKRPAP